MARPLKHITHETKLKIGTHLHVVKSETHDRSGAQLILASVDPARNDGRDHWIVDWVAPWQTRLKKKDIVFYDETTAMKRFGTMRHHNPPVTPSLARDWQRVAVYRWEDETLDQNPVALSEPQMKNVVAHISKRFNMAAPAIHVTKPPEDPDKAICQYFIGKHVIEMAENRCHLSWLLHEMAHAIDAKINHNDWSHHGPSFVRTLLSLNGAYQCWHDVEAAEILARKQGLAIANAQALPDLCRALAL